MPTRRLLLGAAAALSLLLGQAPARAQGSAVAAPIEALNAALIDAAKAGKTTPFPQRFQTLAPVVERALDLPTILKTSVGLHWAELPPEQQQRLLQVFRSFTVASYVANFNAYNGEQLVLLPETRAVGQEQVVETQITPKGGKPVRIDYVMHASGDGWQAVDVLLDGSISRVAVQRSDFRALLGSNGNAEPLIQSLQKKVQTLSGGTITP